MVSVPLQPEQEPRGEQTLSAAIQGLLPAMVLVAVILSLVPTARTVVSSLKQVLTSVPIGAVSTTSAVEPSGAASPSSGTFEVENERRDQRFVWVMAALFLVGGGVSVLWIVAAVRTDRLRRFAWIGAGLGLVAAYQILSDRGEPAVAAVERMHFLLYGLLAVLLVRGFRRWLCGPVSLGAWTLVAVGFCAFLDEGLQWVLESRVGELYDVGLNLYAGLAGLLVALGAFPRGGVGPGHWSRWALFAAPLPLCAALFVSSAHLGYLVRDPQIAVFRTYFRPERLLETNAERDRRWRTGPSTGARPAARWRRLLKREDLFRTEAGWRVHARNDAFRDGRMLVAERENRILERYYSAFLDREHHRLEPWKIELLESARKEHGGELYASGVGSDRIWLRPTRPQLWGAAWAVAAVLMTTGSIGALRDSRRPSPRPGDR